jgi:hypothetical protein
MCLHILVGYMYVVLIIWQFALLQIFFRSPNRSQLEAYPKKTVLRDAAAMEWEDYFISIISRR